MSDQYFIWEAKKLSTKVDAMDKEQIKIVGVLLMRSVHDEEKNF